MLIDDVTIKIRSGHGGRGKVAFNKNANSLGPVGGSGGNGGSLYMEGTSDLSALGQFRYKKELAAEDGENGKSQFSDGHNGSDLTLKVPTGTVIHNLTTGADTEILNIGEPILIARGGHGGKGNFLFRSSRNTSPTQFQKGLPAEEFTLRLELKLIADVGLIGLPNVGKSSLLNTLTRAQSKVANYAFTTLEPNLGVYYELILADIPGLIEGAAEGKGLGVKFLRHVERTGTLFHLVSAESETPAKDYKTIRHELGAYNKTLLKKTEYLFLTKCDLRDGKEIKKKLTALKKCNPRMHTLSLSDSASVKKVEKILRDLIKRK
jgi:GTP-binding protein